MEIKIEPHSFARTECGMVTGIIFLKDKEYYFPDINWNDSALFVLSAFTSNLSKRINEFEVLYMEAPCEVRIMVDYKQNSITFICQEREKPVEYETTAVLSVFLKNLYQEMNYMIRESTILTNEEIDRYNTYLTSIHQMYKEYDPLTTKKGGHRGG